MAYKSNSENKIKPRKKSSNAQSIDGDLGGRAGKDREEIELQLNAAVSQLDKFRNMMREKDLTIQSLKQEIMVTKQRERRCIKDLEILQTETMEAPATIKHLREDLVLAKSKMKAYSSQIGEDSRFIRSLNDEKAKQKEQIVHLTTLVNSKNLEEREVLYDKLDKSNQKVTELQKLYSEAEKRLEMIDKTLSTDNKYLRARIHTMEKELKELQNQAKEMNESLKEKDKVVASLSIYRYNALHKKHESPPPCKVCIEREQIELERSRIAAIKAKIPILEIECIKVTRGDSVSVHLKDTLPNAELDSFTLNYSEDPSLEEKLQTKHVKVKNGHEIEIPNVAVNSLKNGVTYYFRVVAANGDIEGKPSKMHEVVVDCPPQQPNLITTMIEYEKKQIQILFKQPEISDGSPISSFKIYYSSTPTPESKSLFKKVNYDEVFKDTNGNLLVSYDNPVVGTPYYFFVTACNKIGESLPSEASPVNIVDYKPSKPEAPLVKKLDGKTVVVFGKSVVGEGSPPSHFVLITEKSGVTVKSRHEVMTRHTSISEMKLFYAVDEGIKYRFAISAVNKEGESEVSSYTPEVDIEFMVPALKDVNLKIVSPTCFQVGFHGMKPVGNVSILGYKLKWSTWADMRTLAGASNIIPIGSKPIKIDGLEYGGSYYVTACLVGEEEDGLEIRPLYVPLAAAIPLPKSPPPISNFSKSSSIAKSLNMAKLDSIANSKTRLNGNDKNAKEFIAYRAPLGYPLRKGGKSGVQNSASSNDIKNPRTNAQLRKASLANPEIKHSSKELKPLKSK